MVPISAIPKRQMVVDCNEKTARMEFKFVLCLLEGAGGDAACGVSARCRTGLAVCSVGVESCVL